MGCNTSPTKLAAALAGLLVCLGGCRQLPAEITASNTITLQLLAINDLHGVLEPPTAGLPQTAAGEPIPAGGVARLATLVEQRRAGQRHSLLVGAGDLIGASPLLSSSFHDEPTLEFLTAMGLELSAVGNHEFDEGLPELQRLQQGGCHPQDGCRGPARFEGAGFQYLAANVVDTVLGKTVFPAHVVREFDGIRVGFIGLTLEGTASLLVPSSRASLQFLDEADTINREVVALRREGVEAIVVLLHEGGTTVAGPQDCASLSGSITSILPRLDRAVDVVISGHTHRAYQCDVDGILLTSAGQYGTQLSDLRLTLERASGDIIDAVAQTLVVSADLPEHPAIAAKLAQYRALAAPLLQRQVGNITAPLGRERSAGGESVMGAVVADAMLAAARANTGENVEVAFMNPGGVRADLAAAGPVSFADLFAVQPFGNTLELLTMKGSDILAILQEQFARQGPLILQVSAGFHYRWRMDGDRAQVVEGSVSLNGEPLQLQRDYRIVTNNYLAEGGDGFTAFAKGRSALSAGGDVEALEAYLAERSPFSPPVLRRIERDLTP